MSWLKENAAVVGLIAALAGSGFTQWQTLTAQVARIEAHLAYTDMTVQRLDRR